MRPEKSAGKDLKEVVSRSIMATELPSAANFEATDTPTRPQPITITCIYRTPFLKSWDLKPTLNARGYALGNDLNA